MSRTIETTITIDAAPDKVWRVLADLPRWSEWNPFITEASGGLAVGERLAIQVVPPGQKAARFTPEVIEVEEARALRWRGSLPVPGLFVGEHYFGLSTADDGTRLTHGERFSGLLIPLMGGMLRATEEGFHEMNAALKARVEGEGAARRA